MTLDARTLGLIAGPLISITMMLFPGSGGLPHAAWMTAACMVWMAVWWVTEATSVSVTALLPIVLFPLVGISDVKTVTSSFAHPSIYLFMGGFLLALSIEKWNLHKRIALFILLRMGGTASAMIFGFMLVAALLSMWISNTATTMMLLPIGLAIISMIDETVEADHEEKRKFKIALLLSIAYAATIGGVATLIGTPPNTLMAGYLEEQHNIQLGFAQWMSVGLPVTFIMLPLVWLILTRVLFRLNFSTKDARQTLLGMQSSLGSMAREEKMIAIVFFITAMSWAFRPLLDNLPGLSKLSDTGIAMMAGLSLFLLPAPSNKGQRLLEWEDTRRLPWGILILFGGGLALAAAVGYSGLAEAIGNWVTAMGIVKVGLLVIVVATIIIFMTEFTGNLAVAATFFPIIGAVAVSAGLDPVTLIVPVALAASCAFMLPVATPPNAIVYGAGVITIPQMAKAGFWLNVIGITVVSLVSIFVVPVLLTTGI